MSLVKGLKTQAKETIETLGKPTIETDTPAETVVEAPAIDVKKEDPIVNLVAKVPLSHRNHWVGEARKEGKTLTAVVSELLARRYGTPGN